MMVNFSIKRNSSESLCISFRAIKIALLTTSAEHPLAPQGGERSEHFQSVTLVLLYLVR